MHPAVGHKSPRRDVVRARRQARSLDDRHEIEGGRALGICVLKGNNLRISLNDSAAGRPRDFDQQKHGMVLALQRFRSTSLVVMDSDGSNPHAILTMPDFTFVGSPRWSHDGRKVAFDGWRGVMGEGGSDAHVLVANADGSGVKDLGPGALPSWSPDDKQITFCRYSPERGVFIMNADGSDRARSTPRVGARNGLPSGTRLPTPSTRGTARCSASMMWPNTERRELEHKAYSQIYWGITWSPDGDWICFKGVLPDGGNEIAAISVKGEKEGFKVLLPSSAKPEVGNSCMTVSWGGGKQVLVCMQKKSDRTRQLYVVDAAGVKPPRLFSNFPASWVCDNVAWSCDGKKVVMSAARSSRNLRRPSDLPLSNRGTLLIAACLARSPDLPTPPAPRTPGRSIAVHPRQTAEPRCHWRQ